MTNNSDKACEHVVAMSILRNVHNGNNNFQHLVEIMSILRKTIIMETIIFTMC